MFKIRNSLTLSGTVVACLIGQTTTAQTIVGGEAHSIALRADGSVFAWGQNNYGSLGTGLSSNSAVPLVAKSFTGAKAVGAGDSHTLIAKADGTAWAWGYNGSGQLGTGDTTSFYAPVQVQYLTNVNTVAAGCSFSMALKSDQTVWSWGNNSYGQLGYPGGSKSAPLAIASLGNIAAIAAGCNSGYALKGDGTVWAWGYNGYGQLGTGNTSNSSVPVQVVGATGIKAIAAGSNHVIALKQDGTVLTWGRNDYCQLGNTLDRYNYCAYSSAPTAIAGLNNVMQIAASSANTLALKSDGTVWTIGANTSGQLGNGSATGYGKSSFTPVQVTGLTGISEIASTRGDHLLARKASGEVFAWGYNSYGQLGKGDSSTYNEDLSATTPVQVFGPGGDGKLNLVSAGTVTTEKCIAPVTFTTGISLNVPCADYGSTRYQLKLILDPTITTGTYFKLLELR